MNCPKCGEKTRVVFNRKTETMVVRYRKCPACRFTHFTSETVCDSEVFNRIQREKYRRKKVQNA